MTLHQCSAASVLADSGRAIALGGGAGATSAMIVGHRASRNATASAMSYGHRNEILSKSVQTDDLTCWRYAEKVLERLAAEPSVPKSKEKTAASAKKQDAGTTAPSTASWKSSGAGDTCVVLITVKLPGEGKYSQPSLIYVNLYL
eukprot:16895-Heterococcus_DN1.PRE.2